MEEAAMLMMRVRERDSHAFEALYDRYHRLVYGLALRMLGETVGAEDVTQTIFLKIWSAPERFESGNFPGWIVRMTRNRCLDLLRSKSRNHDELPLDALSDDVLEEQAFADLDAQRVRSAIAQLPANEREPIELGFFAGFTHEEIARRCGAPLGTVKTRIRTGLRRLRSALDGVTA